MTTLARRAFSAWASVGGPTLDGDYVHQATDKVMQVSHEAESSTKPAALLLPDPEGDEDASPYKVSRERQIQDPHLGLLISRMESTTLIQAAEDCHRSIVGAERTVTIPIGG